MSTTKSIIFSPNRKSLAKTIDSIKKATKLTSYRICKNSGIRDSVMTKIKSKEGMNPTMETMEKLFEGAGYEMSIVLTPIAK